MEDKKLGSNTTEKLYSLEFHKEYYTGSDNSIRIIRVPGGWVYTFHRLDAQQMNSIFVPFNNEFQQPIKSEQEEKRKINLDKYHEVLKNTPESIRKDVNEMLDKLDEEQQATDLSPFEEDEPVKSNNVGDVEIIRLQNIGIAMANDIEQKRKEIESLKEQLAIASEQIPKGAFEFKHLKK